LLVSAAGCTLVAQGAFSALPGSLVLFAAGYALFATGALNLVEDATRWPHRVLVHATNASGVLFAALVAMVVPGATQYTSAALVATMALLRLARTAL
jgi:hypothetical protein